MSNATRNERTYGQWCPVAAGLDVLGDRWVLLICRELIMGDRRFTDLRAALPGLAPNLLTERLRALQAEGLVETVELPPPAARTVYRITNGGREISAVLRSLARFGVSRLEGSPGPAFDATRAAHALVLPWRTRAEANLRVRLVLRRDDGSESAADVVLTGTRTQVQPADDDGVVDVTITTDAISLAAARRTGEPLAAAVVGRAADRKAALAALGINGVAPF